MQAAIHLLLETLAQAASWDIPCTLQTTSPCNLKQSSWHVYWKDLLEAFFPEWKAGSQILCRLITSFFCMYVSRDQKLVWWQRRVVTAYIGRLLGLRAHTGCTKVSHLLWLCIKNTETRGICTPKIGNSGDWPRLNGSTLGFCYHRWRHQATINH